MPATYQNDLVLYTHHFKHDLMPREAVITGALNDGTINSSAQTWADEMQTLAADKLDNYLDSSVQLMRTTTLKGDGSSAFTVGTSTANPTRGINAASGTTPNTAVLVQKRTGVGGRGGRGRWYLPFMLNEGEVDETGALASGYRNGIQLQVDSYLTALASAMRIANRTYDLPWDNPNRQLLSVTMGPVVTKLQVSPIAATQRRRMPRA